MKLAEGDDEGVDTSVCRPFIVCISFCFSLKPGSLLNSVYIFPQDSGNDVTCDPASLKTTKNSNKVQNSKFIRVCFSWRLTYMNSYRNYFSATGLNVCTLQVTERWQWLSIDVTGPFPDSKGPYSHIVVICDYYTKWIEIFPSEKPNSDSIALFMCDAISRYGYPLGFLTPWGARGVQVRTVSHAICLFQ